jgi:hypothetical protein
MVTKYAGAALMAGKITVRSYVASAILAGAIVLAPVLAGYAPASSKTPFTITNDPVGSTVVDTMQQRTCTGTVVPIWWSGQPNFFVRAIFYRRPDGTKWVDFYHSGLGPDGLRVTELGVSAQWTGLPDPLTYRKGSALPHYAVWPKGDNRLSGITVEPYGTIDLTCD